MGSARLLLASSAVVASSLFLSFSSTVQFVQANELGFTYPYAACRVGSQTAFAVGDTTYVCLNFNGKVVSLFNVVTDTFAAISIAASNYALPVGTGYIREGQGWNESIYANSSETTTFYSTFDLASSGVFAPYPRIYKKLTYTPLANGDAQGEIATIPIFTAIIQMENGVVTDIGWDDGCFFCPENTDECTFSALSANTSTVIANDALRGCRKSAAECYPDTFADSNSTTINATSLTDSGCDLKVFLTWTGTDRNGQFLRSAGKRFSRYRAFGVATAYQSALNIANEGLNIATTAIGELKAVPGKILPGMTGEEGRRLKGSDNSNSAASPLAGTMTEEEATKYVFEDRYGHISQVEVIPLRVRTTTTSSTTSTSSMQTDFSAIDDAVAVAEPAVVAA